MDGQVVSGHHRGSRGWTRIYRKSSNLNAPRKGGREFQKTPDDLRHAPNAKLLEEYRCVCNWLSESDGISDFVLRAQDYREMIAFGEWAETGDDYLRAL